MDANPLNKFYKKTTVEKIEALKAAEIISDEDYEVLIQAKRSLPIEVAEQMIENYIVHYELPFGLAMNFVIDGESRIIPMVTEEPSVIAAASNAGKIIGQSGGFQTEMKERLLIGQMAFKEVADPVAAKEAVLARKADLLELANAAHPSIVTYGGGARRLDVRLVEADSTFKTPAFFVVHLYVDTGEAMGANIVNTMVEALSPVIADLVAGESLMNILSNYSTESLATATCAIDPKYLATKDLSGEEVRDRIIEATQFATVDPYRAVTHNKGAMNGIDAVLLATGNDWRAVEAGVHAYASRSGQYRSLTRWSKDDDGFLRGEITLPLSVGSVGGTLSIHPTAQFAYRLLGEPNARELSCILASVGLAQNFSAIRALVTEGIQKGHMGLQARSLAIRVGASGEEVEWVSEQLKKSEYMNSTTALELLKVYRKQTSN